MIEMAAIGSIAWKHMGLSCADLVGFRRKEEKHEEGVYGRQ